VPPRPFKPDLPLNAGVGAMGGLFLGIMLVLVREGLDRRVRSPIELRSYLTAPELGAVPFVSPGECVPRTRDIPLRRIKPDESSPYPIPWTQNAFADSLRASLASILRSNGKRSAPKLILVTSPAAGDGKTTMVSSLGLALAE